MHYRRCTVRRDMMTMIETKTTTSEMTKSETNKASETKHEASGWAREPQDPQAHEIKRPRDQELIPRAPMP